ncbi:2,4'-dihydroxyacetophenone dioxygenase family protein [Hyphococcus luteus]|jgi:hypothetical protein|nr:2,4'-dihydroxyacetophenone dioxygenase family protein [Marinicaulis flavus]
MAKVGDATMKAPESGDFKIVDVPEPFKELIQRRGVEGSYVGDNDVESPWVPFGENAAIRYLAFDVRNNWVGNVLWVKSPGVVSTHKHRGQVLMLCLEGSFRYLEYDWVAYPGAFIHEMPGEAHTLVTDDPNGVKLFGWMQGANEFYDEEGNLIDTVDVWWFLDHYESYCEEQGIPVNKQLYI